MGILIALAVNEAWNRHNDKVRGEEELEAVRQELKTSQELLGRVLESDSISLVANAAMLAIVGSGTSRDVAMPKETFRYLRYASTYDPPMGRVQSLISTGNLRLIRDSRVRAGLASWPSRVEAARGHQDRMRDFWNEAIAPYLRSYGYAPEIWGQGPDSVIELRRSDVLAGLLYQRQFHGRIVAASDKAVNARLSELIALLDSAARSAKR
jgi:hypothetical protein